MDEAAIEAARADGPARPPRRTLPPSPASQELPALLGQASSAKACGRGIPDLRQHRRPTVRPLRRLPHPSWDWASLTSPTTAKSAHADIRTAYLAHIDRDAGARRQSPDPAGSGRSASWPWRLGSRRSHLDNVSDRDAVATYTLLTGHANSDALTPAFRLGRVCRVHSRPRPVAFDEVVVRQPEYFVSAFDAALTEVDDRRTGATG
jgi:hypothetical protein